MWNFLAPPAFKPEQTGPEADARYNRLRWQVFIGIFIGYAGFYIVRKNFSMAIPMLAPFGFEKGELGVVLSMNAIAYGFSKFVMASISDRSNARRFLPLGLILAAISMMFMIVPVQCIGSEHKGAAIALMAVLNFLVGWFNGMGWPPCGRVMTHWFSIKERGTWMSFWNCAHNVGGALVGPMSVYGAVWFGSWFYGADSDSYFLIGTYLFPAAVAILIAIVAYCMIRDTPQSCGLPSIEKWRNDYADTYNEKAEEVLSTKEIFRTVLTNKFLWYIPLPMLSSIWCATVASTGHRPSLRSRVSTSRMPAGLISPTRWPPSLAQSSAAGSQTRCSVVAARCPQSSSWPWLPC